MSTTPTTTTTAPPQRQLFSPDSSSGITQPQLDPPKPRKTGFKGSAILTKHPVQVERRNERERKRVQHVNKGFVTLRNIIPLNGKQKKLSKVETLRQAAKYIKALNQILSGQDPGVVKFEFPGTPTPGASGGSIIEGSSTCSSPTSPQNDDNNDDSRLHHSSEDQFNRSLDTSSVTDYHQVTSSTSHPHLDYEQQQQQPPADAGSEVAQLCPSFTPADFATLPPGGGCYHQSLYEPSTSSADSSPSFGFPENFIHHNHHHQHHNHQNVMSYNGGGGGVVVSPHYDISTKPQRSNLPPLIRGGAGAPMQQQQQSAATPMSRHYSSGQILQPYPQSQAFCGSMQAFR